MKLISDTIWKNGRHFGLVDLISHVSLRILIYKLKLGWRKYVPR